MQTHSWEQFSWSDLTDPDLEALTLAFIQPASSDVTTVLDVIEPVPQPLTVREALDWSLGIDDFAWRSELAQTDRLSDWTVVIEPNGWGLALPDTVAALSNDGTAISVFWNVNAAMSLCLARRGRVVRAFDPLLYEAGDDALPAEAGLPFGIEHARSSALALAATITGVDYGRDWLLGRRRPTYRIRIHA